jgi:hypothetical protein
MVYIVVASWLYFVVFECELLLASSVVSISSYDGNVPSGWVTPVDEDAELHSLSLLSR